MLNNIKLGTTCGMVVNETKYCNEYEERVFSTYPRRKFICRYSANPKAQAQESVCVCICVWGGSTLRVVLAYLLMHMQQVFWISFSLLATIVEE